MGLYLRELRGIPRLSAEEEQACAHLAAQGDEAARQRLIQANLRFVIMVAKRYLNRGVPLEDLVNEGNIGLIHAAGRFDPDRGVRFVTYAVWWIRQAILKAIRPMPTWTISLDSPIADLEDAEPFGACLADTSAEKPEEAMVATSLQRRARYGAGRAVPTAKPASCGIASGSPATAGPRCWRPAASTGSARSACGRSRRKALRKIRVSSCARQLEAYAN